MLSLLDLALGHPLGELLAGNAVLLGVVEDNEALHLDAHGDDTGDVGRALGLGAVVLADAAAHDEAGVLLGAGKAHVEDLASDVVKVDVNVVGRGLLELLLEVGILVVQGNVEAELLNEPLALVVAAGKANDAGAVDLGNLAGNAASSTGGARDNDCLASLGLANLGHTSPGSEAGHAQDREHVLGLLQAGEVGRGLKGTLAQNSVLSPASEAADIVASSSLLALGGNDTADGRAAHDLADLDGRDVRSNI